jgi:regulator of sigma E protease
MQFLAAFLAIIVLIVVHEWGHFAVARWCKMKVEKFSIFFGPAIAKIKTKTTTYQIGTLPLGGFVQITGMNPMEDHDPKDPYIYPNRPAWQRFLTILAGPAMNYVAAVFIVFGIFAAWGIPEFTKQQQVASLIEKSPAAAAGIQPGDMLVSIDGEPTDLDHQARKILDERKGKPVTVKVLRDGKPLEVTLTPRWDERDGGHFLIGVQLMPVEEFHRRGIFAAAKASIVFPIVKTGDIIVSLSDMVRGKQKADVSGPIQITYQLGKQIRRGPREALIIIASLSIFLGLFNLLPLPALDGGRLAFLAYEIISRRRVNQRVEAGVHMIGVVVLLGVMVLVMFKDVRQFFVHGG